MSSKIAKLLPLQRWDFVEDADLRSILVRDYRELRRIIKAGARKSAVVMCGSIMEAILLYKLYTPEVQAKYQDKYGKPLESPQAKRWELEDLINLITNLGYLDENARSEAHFVRNYRNLIHPGKEKRGELKVTGELLVASTALLTHVMKSLTPPKQPKIRPLPDQIFLKKLGKKCIPSEVEAVRRIMEWANQRGFTASWTSSQTYVPRLRYNGYTYSPLAIRPDGKIQIRFKHLGTRPSIFQLQQHRETLRQRLNQEALGQRFPEKVIDRNPAVHIHVLATEPELTNFLHIFDWVVQSIMG